LEALDRSSAAGGGSFSPILRFEKLEIHKVFLRFPNLGLTKNLSLPALADQSRASGYLRKSGDLIRKSGDLIRKIAKAIPQSENREHIYIYIR